MHTPTHFDGWRLAASVTASAIACLACPQVFADATPLATQSGQELGLSLSGYRYEEASVMSLTARHIGLDYSATHAWGGTWPRSNEGWFVRGAISAARGKADYRSPISGSLNGTPNGYIDLKSLLGRDIDMGTYNLAPYAGLGYRRLSNDLRGTSSTGEQGYRRTSIYTYMPVGVTHRMNLADQSQLNTTVEYQHLINGQQEARLSDVAPNQADLSLKQRKGYGVQLKAMVQKNNWSWGPAFTYWNIKASEPGGTPAYTEPPNKTYEFGLKAAYHF